MSYNISFAIVQMASTLSSFSINNVSDGVTIAHVHVDKLCRE